MLIEVIKSKNIICLIYDKPRNMMKAMLRFQEHYESPEFAGKVFKLPEFKKWYIKNSPNGKKTGKFTYYTDWDGCNFTDKAIKAFKDGLFDPLNVDEKEILSHLPNSKCYVIAISINEDDPEGSLWHEFAHATYYLNPIYRKFANRISKPWNGTKEQETILKFGYRREVLKDETQAFILSGIEVIESDIDYILARARLKKALLKMTNIKNILERFSVLRKKYWTKRKK